MFISLSSSRNKNKCSLQNSTTTAPPSFFASASRIDCDIVSFQHLEHMWLVFDDLQSCNGRGIIAEYVSEAEANKTLKFRSQVSHIFIRCHKQEIGAAPNILQIESRMYMYL